MERDPSGSQGRHDQPRFVGLSSLWTFLGGEIPDFAAIYENVRYRLS